MIRFDAVTYTYPFQARPAVEDIAFAVKPGELVLCTGASGCGKSTLMRLANGLCPHYYQGALSGTVTVNGRATVDSELHELADDVGTLFQNPEEQFFALGVEDELVFAHEWRGRSVEDIEKRIRPVTEDFGLSPVLASSVHELSDGQKQKVGLASVLSQQPRALILDEPTANLDPEATGELAKHLVRLKNQGIAILVVDHRLYWLEHAADRVLVMGKGRIMEKGPFALLRDPALRERYGLRGDRVKDPRSTLPDVGRPEAGRPEAGKNESAPDKALCVNGLSFAYKGKAPLFTDASCAVPEGITAIIGGNGVGKTTFARLLTGLNKAKAGTFSMDGQTLTPDKLLRRASIVLQNADHQLYMRTALEELTTCLRLGVPGKEDMDEVRARAMAILERFDLADLAERHPQSLSGGEKQRLVIACAMAKNPDVLILDEPTSGLDGRNMRRIANALRESASTGARVLVITHDLELMAGVCQSALRLPLRPSPQGAGAPGEENRPAA